MDAVSMDPLEAAAEATIAAAAAALLWGGDDGHGVLAHIAGLTAWRMAASRQVHLYLVQTAPDHVGQPYDDQLAGPSAQFCLAALPAWAARRWAARVSTAVGEAEEKLDRLAGQCARIGCGARAVRKLHQEKTKLTALQTIALWGRDGVDVQRIVATARLVTTDATEVTCDAR